MPPKRTKKKALSPANESRVNELEQFLFTNVEDLFEKRKQAIDEFIIRGSAELYQTISHIVSQVSLDAFFCDLFDKKENDPAQTGGPTRKKSSSRTNSSAINVNVPCTTRKEVKQEEPDSNERKTRSVRDSVRAKNGQLPVHQDTVLRAPGTSRMPHSLAVQTPFGVRNVNLPKFITPRVDGNADKCQLTGRVMRADEIAFSVTGSPVVAPPATPAPEQQLLHQVLNMPETELSPDTRQIAVAIKTLVKKKAQTGE